MRNQKPKTNPFDKLRVDAEQSRSIKNQKFKREFSGGGVVFRKFPIKWLVVQHSGHKGWVFPKGLVEESESLKEAAVREVKEESGIKAKVLEKIGNINLFFWKPVEEGSEKKEKVFQTAAFYLMEYVSGETKDHSWETSEAVWLPFEKAKERLSFKNSKEILEKAVSILEKREKQPKLI